MSSSQKHRGQHSQDAKLFAPTTWKILNDAVDDLSWLWTRGYAEKAGIKLVGDKYKLTSRQRQAIRRASCTDEAMFRRPSNRIEPADLAGKAIAIDGYNLLITIESGLANGLIIACRDGTYRDIASIHSTYRRVEETFPAIRRIAGSLANLKVASVKWYLDKPISNSGRLKGFLLESSQEFGVPWEVELANNPDRELIETTDAVVVSSDGIILDQTKSWCNLTRHIVDSLPDPQIIPMQGNRFASGSGL